MKRPLYRNTKEVKKLIDFCRRGGWKRPANMSVEECREMFKRMAEKMVISERGT